MREFTAIFRYTNRVAALLNVYCGPDAHKQSLLLKICWECLYSVRWKQWTANDSAADQRDHKAFEAAAAAETAAVAVKNVIELSVRASTVSFRDFSFIIFMDNFLLK